MVERQSGREATTIAIGNLGEDLVARWLQHQGWQVLDRHWHCRWGELDLVMGLSDPDQRAIDQPKPNPSKSNPLAPKSLAFVEVKTRNDRNWDESGALAITRTKQKKLWKTAQLFLTHHPGWETLPCQFDVALVTCEPLHERTIQANHKTDGTVAIAAGYRVSLFDYIPAAFMG
jgi:putative endonuclease